MMASRALGIFLLICCLRVLALASGKQLEMVHLLYRHGARSPVKFYPTNPYQEKDWPDGAGRLTQIGMQLEYALGKFLKKRYIQNMSFIHSSYLHKEVYIRSSNSERCLQSAETQLAGFYPPAGRQVWNKDIAWQPVPVQTVPSNQDPLLRPGDTYCPKRDKLWKEKLSSDIYKEKKESYKELFAYLSQHAGMEVTMENVFILLDDYLCENKEGLSSPKWLTDRLNELVAISNWEFLYRFSGDDQMGRLLGGTLLAQIVDNMNGMSKGGNESLYKMNIFSGHDSSILSLMAALNISLGISPTFAACFIIELYADESNQYFVEMKYRNDSSGNTFPFSLNSCEYRCPLDQFVSLTKNRVTRNQKDECGGGSFLTVNLKYIQLKHFKTVLIALLAVVVVLLTVLCALCVHSRCCRLKKAQYGKKYILHEDEKIEFMNAE